GSDPESSRPCLHQHLCPLLRRRPKGRDKPWLTPPALPQRPDSSRCTSSLWAKQHPGRFACLCRQQPWGLHWRHGDHPHVVSASSGACRIGEHLESGIWDDGATPGVALTPRRRWDERPSITGSYSLSPWCEKLTGCRRPAMIAGDTSTSTGNVGLKPTDD